MLEWPRARPLLVPGLTLTPGRTCPGSWLKICQHLRPPDSSLWARREGSSALLQNLLGKRKPEGRPPALPLPTDTTLLPALCPDPPLPPLPRFSQQQIHPFCAEASTPGGDLGAPLSLMPHIRSIGHPVGWLPGNIWNLNAPYSLSRVARLSSPGLCQWPPSGPPPSPVSPLQPEGAWSEVSGFRSLLCSGCWVVAPPLSEQVSLRQSWWPPTSGPLHLLVPLPRTPSLQVSM